MSDRAIPFLLLLALLVSCGERGDLFVSAQAGPGSLHATCDSALTSRSVTDGGDRVLSVRAERVVPLPDAVGVIGDVIATADGFFVLDMSNRRIAQVDSTGRLLRQFAQSGEGPGDLSFPIPTWTTASRLALTGNGHLLAVDRRSLKAYDTEAEKVAVEWDQPVTSFYEANNEGMHLAYVGGQRVLFSESGKRQYRDSTRDVRTAVRISAIDVATKRSQTMFRADNPLSLRAHIPRIPPRMPYDDEYRRLWDADSTALVIYSYRRYGVCFFDSAGELAAAHSRGTRSYPVDDAERSRVMTELFGTRHDVPLPVIGKTAIEYLANKWPEHGPFYTDVVRIPGEGALLLRRVSATKVVGDVISETRGYLGTIDLPLGILPRRVSNGEAITIDRADVQLRLFRWE